MGDGVWEISTTLTTLSSVVYRLGNTNYRGDYSFNGFDWPVGA